MIAAGRGPSDGIQRKTGRRCPWRGAPPPGRPAGQASEKSLGQVMESSVCEDVFVVRHGAYVVARSAGPRPGVRVWLGAGRSQQRRDAPKPQMPEGFFDHGALVKGRPEAEGCRLEIRNWGFSPTDRARGGRLEEALLAQ